MKELAEDLFLRFDIFVVMILKEMCQIIFCGDIVIEVIFEIWEFFGSNSPFVFFRSGRGYRRDDVRDDVTGLQGEEQLKWVLYCIVLFVWFGLVCSCLFFSVFDFPFV